MGSLCPSCGVNEVRRGRRECLSCIMFPRNLQKYGLTLEGYEALLKAQRGVCAICKEPESSMRRGKIRRLCIDHNHKTGEVRGLLCNACNRALGLFQDSSEVIEAAFRYLQPDLEIEVRCYLAI